MPGTELSIYIIPKPIFLSHIYKHHEAVLTEWEPSQLGVKKSQSDKF